MQLPSRDTLVRRVGLVPLLLLVPALALAQARPLEVRSLGGRCGEAARGADIPPATLEARASLRGDVTVSISRFPFYCSPAPRFDARLREDGTIVLTAREPEAPAARCTCPHQLRLGVRTVPPGVHPIEVRFRDEVLARGEIGVANVRRR